MDEIWQRCCVVGVHLSRVAERTGASLPTALNSVVEHVECKPASYCLICCSPSEAAFRLCRCLSVSSSDDFGDTSFTDFHEILNDRTWYKSKARYLSGYFTFHSRLKLAAILCVFFAVRIKRLDQFSFKI